MYSSLQLNTICNLKYTQKESAAAIWCCVKYGSSYGESCELQWGFHLEVLCFVWEKSDRFSTWGWSSGKSPCWDRASRSFPDSFSSYSHSLTALWAFCTGIRLEESKELDTHGEIFHTTHGYAEPIHNYFFQDIPTHSPLHYARGLCLSQQTVLDKIQSLSWNTACTVTLSLCKSNEAIIILFNAIIMTNCHASIEKHLVESAKM